MRHRHQAVPATCSKWGLSLLLVLFSAPSMLVGQGVPVLPAHDLLIVAPQKFDSVLQPLIAHKRGRGVRTEMLTLETATTLFPGFFAAEKVKIAIAVQALLSGTRYVMLVGDSDEFPVRYVAHAVDYDTDPTEIVFGNSDLYYADYLDTDANMQPIYSYEAWNAQNAGWHWLYFGQLHKKGEVNFDAVDMIPEIAVGRLPASTAAEVSTYVQKVIRYENGQAPGNSALIVAAPAASNPTTYSQNLAQSFQSGGFAVQRLYDPTYASFGFPAPTNTNMIAALDAGKKFVSVVSHGNSSGWSFFNSNDVSRLNNANRLPVLFATSCDVARFAPKEGEPFRNVLGKDVWMVNDGHLAGFEISSSRTWMRTERVAPLALNVSGTIAEKDDEADERVALDAGDLDGNGVEEVLCAERYHDGTAERVALWVYAASTTGWTRTEDVRLYGDGEPVLASGDVTGDGRDDIVLGMLDGGGRVTLLAYQNASTGLTRIGDLRITGLTDFRVSVADVDRDGRGEIVLTAVDAAQRATVLVYDVNPGTVQLSQLADLRVAGLTEPVGTAVQIDADSEHEIVLSGRDGAGRLAILVHDFDPSSGTLRRIGDLRLSMAADSAIAGGNFDNDAAQELAVFGNSGGTQTALLVHDFDPATGAFRRTGDIRLNDVTRHHLTARDLDGDGRDEIIAAGKDGFMRGMFMIYQTTGQGALTRLADYREDASTAPIGLVCGQFDQDAQLEVCSFTYVVPHLPWPPADVQPAMFDPESLAETMLVQRAEGAVAMISGNTGTQHWGMDLGTGFFGGYLASTSAPVTVGDMWVAMIKDYYSVHGHPRGSVPSVPNCLQTNTCWATGAEFFQPAKHVLFGDPSLRLR